jgi:hypothetical protein
LEKRLKIKGCSSRKLILDRRTAVARAEEELFTWKKVIALDHTRAAKVNIVQKLQQLVSEDFFTPV